MEVCRMVHGSGLYGTSTPDSDQDFKGIRLSSWEEIALGKIPKQYLTHVKLGMYDCKIVAPVLEDLIDEIKELMAVSTLPQKADVLFWEDWITHVIEDYVVPWNGPTA